MERKVGICLHNSSREWLREIEVMDQVIQLYPELNLFSCQVGNLSYQDVFYDPRVGINIIPKSLVLEAFPDKPLSFLRSVSNGFLVKP
jgi:hypothetical protein